MCPRKFLQAQLLIICFCMLTSLCSLTLQHYSHKISLLLITLVITFKDAINMACAAF
jgi:hypothetical protein